MSLNVSRYVCAGVAIVLLTAGPAYAQSRFYSFERNFDRPGSDYSNTASPGAANCSFKCQAQGTRCKAWTYVRPGVQGPKARCYLKSAVPPAVRNACCTSGARKGGSVPFD